MRFTVNKLLFEIFILSKKDLFLNFVTSSIELIKNPCGYSLQQGFRFYAQTFVLLLFHKFFAHFFRST